VNKRRLFVIGLVLVVIVLVGGFIIFNAVFPDNYQPSVTGVPTEVVNSIDMRRTAQAQTKTAVAAPKNSGLATDGITFISFGGDPAASGLFQGQPLYRSCTADRMHAPDRPTATPAGTMQATPEATAAATEAAPVGTPDPIRLSIVGSESEACYEVGEMFLNQSNQFNLAVGVTKSIAGEVEIDRANVANSLVGDIKINISEFQSDERRRDAMIQRAFLESNKYPFATLTDINAVGLPNRPYKDGETLNFQITGTLDIHDTKRPTTFDVTATLTGDLLVVHATTTIQMSDFGFSAPSIAGMLNADNNAKLVLNLVARPATSS
jgi:polyisoprenoid-binding protein YceI